MEPRHLYRLVTTKRPRKTIFRGLSRREFIRYCTGLAIALGLSSDFVPKIARALEEIPRKTPLFWLQSQICTACFVSFVNSPAPAPTDLILDALSLRFLANLTTVSGDLALNILEEGPEKLAGNYVLVVEGAIPLHEEGKYAQYGQKEGRKGPLLNWVKKMAPKAELIIALGTCASYGGIPAAGVTGAQGMRAVLGPSVVNIPGCPPHPDWFVGTLVKLQLFGRDEIVKSLDRQGRPKDFYGELVHDQCPRRHFFEDGKFLEDWNDSRQAGHCLFLKGCKGPVTSADCPKRKWNGGLSWCVQVSHPCIGCTEPQFYQGLSPIYEKLPDISLWGQRARPETIGKVLGAATAIGIGGHLMEQVATGKLPRPKLPPQIKEKKRKTNK